MPYGLDDDLGPEGETFEWALDRRLRRLHIYAEAMTVRVPARYTPTARSLLDDGTVSSASRSVDDASRWVKLSTGKESFGPTSVRGSAAILQSRRRGVGCSARRTRRSRTDGSNRRPRHYRPVDPSADGRRPRPEGASAPTAVPISSVNVVDEFADREVRLDLCDFDLDSFVDFGSGTIMT